MNSKINVLQLTTGFGGELTIVQSLDSYFKTQEIDSKVLCFKKNAKFESLDVWKFGGEFFISLMSYIKLIQEINKSNILIYHCFYNYSSLLIILITKLILRKKLILLAHVSVYRFGNLPLEVWMIIRRFIVWNYALLFADKFVFITEHQRSVYLPFLLAKEYLLKKSIIIPNFIDSSFYKKVEDYKPLKDGKLIALFIGRFEENKGIFDLVEAAKELPKGIEIYLAGGSTDFGLPNVKTLGMIPYDKMSEVYDKASVFILPSYTEVFPTTIIEAFARGLPVITTNADGLDEIVEDGFNGFIGKPGDIRVIRLMLTWCFEHPEQMSRISKINNERALKYLDTNVGKLYKKVIEDLF